MALDEAALEALQKQYGKIGIVDFNGHRVVFKKPTRDQARNYRRMISEPAEKPDSMEFLAQATIVAFDDTAEPNAARVLFTGTFLEEYPMAIGNARFAGCLSVLSGIMDDEEARDLGKGVTVRPTHPKPSPTA